MTCLGYVLEIVAWAGGVVLAATIVSYFRGTP